MAITRTRKGWRASYGGKTRMFSRQSDAKKWAEKKVDPSAVVRKSDVALTRKTNKKKTRSRGKYNT